MDSKFYVAVSFFIEHEGKLLIGKRASWKRTGPGIWEIPAGTLIKGEQPEDAVKREALEELGITIEQAFLFDSYYFERDGKEYVLLNYACRPKSIPKSLTSKEHDQLIWVSQEEAEKYLRFELQKRAVKKYFFLKRKNCY